MGFDFKSNKKSLLNKTKRFESDNTVCTHKICSGDGYLRVKDKTDGYEYLGKFCRCSVSESEFSEVQNKYEILFEYYMSHECAEKNRSKKKSDFKPEKEPYSDRLQQAHCK